MFSSHSSNQSKSAAYAENLYKRSSFYRNWSAVNVVKEKQPSPRNSLNIKEDKVLILNIYCFLEPFKLI